MPVYEYRCRKCDADFERLVRSPSEKVKCPECSGRRVRRKLSVFGMSSKSKGDDRSSTRSSCASCRATSCAGCRK